MKSRNKDRKTHESIIGKIIYGFLLFMPLLAIGVTCAIYTFNFSAKNEVNSKLKYETNEVNSYDDLVNGNIYLFNYTYTINNNNNIVVGNKVVKWDFMDFDYNVGDYYFLFRNPVTNNSAVFILSTNNTSQGAIGYYGTPATFSNNTARIPVVLWNKENLIDNQYWSYFSKCSDEYLVYEETTNDYYNVFYYSIDKVQQNPLFNWAEDSAIYTGMTATCNTLNITTPFIPLLMTYWLIISVIYILYDIILVILHIFHKKIHQLEDSF